MVTSGVGNIPRFAQKPKGKISFTFGDTTKEYCTEAIEAEQAVKGYRDQCLGTLAAQIFILFFSVAALISYARYHACNVIAITLMLIQGVAGLGNIQVGPEKILLDTP